MTEEKKRSLEQQLQVLTSMIQVLWKELDSLKTTGCNFSCVHVSVGVDGGKHVHTDHSLLGSDLTALDRVELDRNVARCYPDTKVTMLSPEPNDNELLDMALISKDMKHIAGRLTRREIQVMRYVADGNTNKQIAYILGLSEQTIKNHVSAILSKLGANDRAHAVSLAMRYGCLSAQRKHEDMVAVSRESLPASFQKG